jgi:tetratricopeptide (TPR) repeat protein
VRLWLLCGALAIAIGIAAWAIAERQHQTKWLEAYRAASDSFNQYNYTGAEGQLRSILPQAEKWWPNGKQLADTLNLLALVYDAENRPKDAEPLCDRAIAIFEKQSSPTSLDLAKAYANEGNVYMHEGRAAAADHRLTQALEIYRKDPTGAGPELGSVLHSLGVLRAVSGQVAQAQPLLEEAVKADEKNLPPLNSDLAQGYLDLAQDYRVQGRISDADEADRKALAIQEKLFGNDSAIVRQTESRLGTNPRAAGAAVPPPSHKQAIPSATPAPN